MPNVRAPQCVSKVPIKVSKSIKLRDKISKTMSAKKMAGVCLTEFAQVFLCFKKFNFSQEACAVELSAFQKCYNARLAEYKAQTDPNMGKVKINALLKKYH